MGGAPVANVNLMHRHVDLVPLAMLFALPCNACVLATYRAVDGVASYNSTPPTTAISTAAAPPAELSGALPMTGFLCIEDLTAVVRLGDRCVLGGPWSHGTAALVSRGDCWLPTAAGLLQARVQTAALDVKFGIVDGPAAGVANLTVGAVTNDGRYLAYRFGGNFDGQQREVECRGGSPR